MPAPKDPIKYQEWITKLNKPHNIDDETRKSMSVYKKGIPLSTEHKQKISESNKGRIKPESERKNISNALKNKPKSEEHKKHISESMIGNIPWNKGIPMSDETKEKIRVARTGTKSSLEAREKISESLIGNTRTLGFKHTTETKKKMRESAHKGPEHHNWKDGVTKIEKAIRRLPEYDTWKNGVFKRDDYTCRDCGRRGGDLEAHHDPKTFAQIIQEYNIKTIENALNCKELWDINNGVTLCVDCHDKRHITEK